MAVDRSDLLQGTLDMLILKIVALGPVHGYGISQRIQQVSREVLQVQQGSLYPALHRLEKRGWLQATWGESESGGKPSSTVCPRRGESSCSLRNRSGTGLRKRSRSSFTLLRRAHRFLGGRHALVVEIPLSQTRA